MPQDEFDDLDQSDRHENSKEANTPLLGGERGRAEDPLQEAESVTSSVNPTQARIITLNLRLANVCGPKALRSGSRALIAATTCNSESVTRPMVKAIGRS